MPIKNKKTVNKTGICKYVKLFTLTKTFFEIMYNFCEHACDTVAFRLDVSIGDNWYNTSLYKIWHKSL